MKIFRKTRHDQIKNRGTLTYLKYAIGEIILVVVGILMALQIDNWNEARNDQQALQEYLIKIKSHTLEDLEQLEAISTGRAQIAEMCKKARISMLDKTEEDNLFILMVSGYAFADYYFKPNTGGYEALKNSGYFGKINNTPLDSLLAKYHGLVERIAENEKSYNDYTVQQEAYLSTQFDRTLILAKAFMSEEELNERATPPEEYDQAFRAYTASAPYRNVINLAAFQLDEMIEQYSQLKELGQKVINEIELITKA